MHRLTQRSELAMSKIKWSARMSSACVFRLELSSPCLVTRLCLWERVCISCSPSFLSCSNAPLKTDKKHTNKQKNAATLIYHVPSSPPKPQFASWLIEQVETGQYTGLRFVGQNIFRVPWKHNSRKDCNDEDSKIFRVGSKTACMEIFSRNDSRK